MVRTFNTITVNDMDDATRQRIIDAGVPIEVYTEGFADLGPQTPAAVTKFANLVTLISKNELPLPPSFLTEMIVERTCGESKLDFREIIDGPPGEGKSYSGMFKCGRYAIETAYRLDGPDGDPRDYFGLNNCALLQDTNGVTDLMDTLGKFQAVFIDDAGVSAGNRDWNTESNKNLSAIMQTCRTKRWYVVLTAPMDKQMDLSIRELVYAKSRIFKPCHAAGFNILKTNRSTFKLIGAKYKPFTPRFTCKDKKVDFYAAFSLDILDPFKGMLKKYDDARDKAADDLIHERAGREREKKDGKPKREKTFEAQFENNKDIIFRHTHNPDGSWRPQRPYGGCKKQEGYYSINEISRETGLTQPKIRRMIGEMKAREKQERGL